MLFVHQTVNARPVLNAHGIVGMSWSNASWLPLLARCRRRDSLTQQEQQCASIRLDVSHALLQFLQFLLKVPVLLRHFFVFGLPLIPGLFQRLDFSLEVACFDIGLAEPLESVSMVQM